MFLELAPESDEQDYLGEESLVSGSSHCCYCPVSARASARPDEGMAKLSWLKQQDGQSGKVPASVLLFLMDTRPARVNSRNSQYDNPRLVIKPSTV